VSLELLACRETYMRRIAGYPRVVLVSALQALSW
jgi:hypothetical protein